MAASLIGVLVSGQAPAHLMAWLSTTTGRWVMAAVAATLAGLVLEQFLQSGAFRRARDDDEGDVNGATEAYLKELNRKSQSPRKEDLERAASLQQQRDEADRHREMDAVKNEAELAAMAELKQVVIHPCAG